MNEVDFLVERDVEDGCCEQDGHHRHEHRELAPSEADVAGLELLTEHKWVSPAILAILASFMGWRTLMRWAGVGRHDPKRTQHDQ